MENSIRQPAAAESFYPAEAQALAQKIKKYLAAAKPKAPSDKIRAIMVPHAGYNFSGPVAAYAYQAIAGRKFRTVVLIGSSHTSYFNGAVIDDHDAWQTPLGDIEVDREFAAKLIAKEKKIKILGSIHDQDHMIEVQLPWLQTVLTPGFKIVPIALGNMENDNYRQLADALETTLTKDDLLVISSDMSHYPAYQDAQRIDQKTLALIEQGIIGELDKHISAIMASGVAGEETLLCGWEAVKTGMDLADKRSWQAKILKYANSGDVPIGDKESVVGYGAVAFSITN
ncbi:MAG: AmmeMemoRadiSam system protein B [Patescibacteria group bacterium]|nr:AmmeMemoRadiSam system protein B [Patescibacteria group bacterium]